MAFLLIFGLIFWAACAILDKFHEQIFGVLGAIIGIVILWGILSATWNFILTHI